MQDEPFQKDGIYSRWNAIKLSYAMNIAPVATTIIPTTQTLLHCVLVLPEWITVDAVGSDVDEIVKR